MRSLIALAAFLALLFVMPSVFRLATSAQTDKERGSITGQVKVSGKPAQGIIVIATPSITDPSKALDAMLNKQTSPKATTDSDGRYRFDDVPSGKYRLVPYAPTLVSDSIEHGSEVTVGGGETEGIDFSLTPGGVITGRITDSEGRPVIGESVSIKSTDDSIQPSANLSTMMGMFGGMGRMYMTDDRGIYRIFGLRPGRYVVSAGSDSGVFASVLRLRPKRTQTFFPGVTDVTRAKPVQVTAGSETTVDIQIALADKGFIVSGRVVDDAKGTPIANAMVAYSKALPASTTKVFADDEDEDEDDVEQFVAGSSGGPSGDPGGFTTTNVKGEFRFEGVKPGSYKLETTSIGMLTGTGTGGFYVDPVPFEVRSANLDRLDIRVHRGAGISGVVVVEGAEGQNGLESFGQVMLMAAVVDAQNKAQSAGRATVDADGSFRITGLKAGKASISMLSMSEPGPALVRIERNGVELHGGIDIQANEQLTGLRLVVTPANCSIRGRVTIMGGPLPPGVFLTATARPLNSERGNFLGLGSAVVDSKGEFVIENLAPITYEVVVTAEFPSGQGGRTVSTKQTVTVTRGLPADVSLVLDVGKNSDK